MGDANTTTINTVILPHWTPEYVQFVSDLEAIGRKWLENNKAALNAIEQQLKGGKRCERIHDR